MHSFETPFPALTLERLTEFLDSDLLRCEASSCPKLKPSVGCVVKFENVVKVSVLLQQLCDAVHWTNAAARVAI